MINPNLEERSAPAEDYRDEAEQCVRRNPASAVLCALGAGLLIALLVRALRPEPTPRQRAQRLLDSLEDRLRSAADPLLRRAGSLASNGADALHGGVRRGEEHMDTLLRRGRRELRRFLS